MKMDTIYLALTLKVLGHILPLKGEDLMMERPKWISKWKLGDPCLTKKKFHKVISYIMGSQSETVSRVTRI
jgi:hypothetical protein